LRHQFIADVALKKQFEHEQSMSVQLKKKSKRMNIMTPPSATTLKTAAQRRQISSHFAREITT
jgi:hypothetical protein